MNRKKVYSTLLLLLAAVIWGSAFVAQSAGMEYVEPFTFNAARSVLGGAVLIPCIMLLDKLAGRKISLWGTDDKRKRRTLLLGGVLCGTALAVASAFQQMGISYTTVGKAGFITALYIVIVPILGMFIGRKASPLVWVSVVIAVAGMYFLCINESLTIGKGDLLVLMCAFVFSVHILIIDRFSSVADGVRMSCIQFFVCAILSAVPMLLFETPKLSSITAAWLPILYAGVMSSGVAYTLQIVGQKNIHPVIASLLLSLESVFSAISGWAILGQTLSLREVLGCALMFAAIIIAQVPVTSGRKEYRMKKKEEILKNG